MKRIIDGKRYDTETAELIAEWGNSYSTSDFKCCAEWLYKTKKGAYFVHGKGGAMSKYAVPVLGGTGGGSALTPISADEARTWLEEHHCTEDMEREFPDCIEDA